MDSSIKIMKIDFFVFIYILQIYVVSTFLFKNYQIPKRHRKNQNKNKKSNIECVQVETKAGFYWYTSSGSSTVCGLYLITEPNQLIKITFHSFTIDCDNSGLLAIVDGWEAKNQYFPSEWDHTAPAELRYLTYCKPILPSTVYVSSQNAALLQFRIPTAGQGFNISIDFILNRQPCNIITMAGEGVYTLRNYGKQINCSVSIMSPQFIQVLTMNVCVTRRTSSTTHIAETGYFEGCSYRGAKDYVEILDGDGMDPSYMWKETDICGLDSNPTGLTFQLGCQHSVLRLVSSGRYYNSITFRFRPTSEEERRLLHQNEC